MKKTTLLFAITFLYAQLAFSQAIINFEKTYHDFGELQEGEAASYSFDVTNTGSTPLFISKVQPSCGCTTPDWTKEPIAPGTKGKVTASYGTQGRPGSFNKSITVYSNDPEKPTLTIFIKGFVSNTPQPSYSAEQLKTSPKIVLEKSEHNFGKVEKNTKVPYKLAVSNLGRSDLKIIEVTSACNCISVTSKPDFIKSGETATLQLMYSPNTTGTAQDVVNIRSNDVTKTVYKFTFSGIVVENLNATGVVKESNNFVPFK